MEVTFQSLTVKNFLAVAEEINWPLENQGLVAILGDNRDSTTADSNGAGKSTLFEALVWGLWGKTVRGLSADEVINRRVGKNCMVQVAFSYDDVGYIVVRCRKDSKCKNDLQFYTVPPNNGAMVPLTQQTIADTQVKIDEVLGIDFETFIRGPMMPQGSFKRFSQMTDAEAKSILESALQVDVLAKAAQVAKERADEARLHLNKVETEIALYVQQLTDNEASLDQLEQRQRDFQGTKESKIDKLDQELQEIKERRLEVLRSVREPSVVEAELEKAKARLLKMRELSDKMSDQWREKERAARDYVGELATAYEVVSRERDQLEARYHRIEKLEGTCPTCERPITQAHQKHALGSMKPQLQRLEAAVKQGEAEVQQAEENRKQVEQESRAASRRAQQMAEEAVAKSEAARQAVRECQQLQQEVAQLEKQEQAAQKRLAEARMEASPFDQMIKDAYETMRQLKKAMGRLIPQREAHERTLAYLEFWRKGFGNQGLKSFIFRAVTPYMNQRAAYYSRILTGGELTIEFTTQATLKNGQVKDQFGVSVTNRNGAATYQGNSGGEKSRADLAINFVLSDLVCSRAQKAFPQRFFDEPFENLDESGVDGVMDLLQDMMQQAGSIFVVTHQQGMAGQFSKAIQVVKENGKSILET